MAGSDNEIAEKLEQLKHLEEKLTGMVETADDLRKEIYSSNGLIHKAVGVSGAVWHGWLGLLARTGKNSFHILQSLEGLVKDGVELESAAKTGLDKQITSAKTSAGSTKDAIQSTVHNIEEEIDTRISKTLNLLGVPTKRDISELSMHISAVATSVAELAKEVRTISINNKSTKKTSKNEAA